MSNDLDLNDNTASHTPDATVVEVRVRTSPRVEALNIADIQSLGIRDSEDARTKDLIAELAALDDNTPVDVRRDADRKLWLATDDIVLLLRITRGDTTIQAYVTDGTEADAVVQWLSANTGMRTLYVSGAEKARAVWKLSDFGLTQAQIVVATGIPKQTVSDYFRRAPNRGDESPNPDEVARREKQRTAAAEKREAQKLTGWRLYNPADPTIQYAVTVSRRPAVSGTGMTGRWEVGNTVDVGHIDPTIIPDAVTLADAMKLIVAADPVVEPSLAPAATVRQPGLRDLTAAGVRKSLDNILNFPAKGRQQTDDFIKSVQCAGMCIVGWCEYPDRCLTAGTCLSEAPDLPRRSKVRLPVMVAPAPATKAAEVAVNGTTYATTTEAV